MSYPHHHGSDRPPYPPSHGAPYPPGPNAQPVYPPSLGFSVDAPIYMPTPGYPPSSSPYPSATPTPYPSSGSSAPYPSRTSAPYPSTGSSAPYPSGNSAPYPSTGSSAPYPSGNSAPYPSTGSSAPYPSGNSAPYPSGASSAPYPSGNSAPNPSGASLTPYPSGNSAPYPSRASSAPHPSGNSDPYSSTGSSAPYPSGKSAPYSSTGSSAPYPSGNSAPYSSRGSSAPYPSGTSAPYPPLSSSSTRAPQKSNSAYPPASSAYPKQSSHYPRQPHQTSYHTPSASYPNAQQSHYPARTNTPSAHYSSGAAAYKGTPTVVAITSNPREDAEVLRKAMKGFGTDEKAIINVLSRRTNAQRLQIAVEFKTMYGKDLIKDLKSETSGKFEDLLVALMTPLPQYYAKELHDAIVGIGTDEDVLIEVLCTKSNNEIRTIRQAYHSMYGKPLEDDLKGDTSGTFKRLMVSLCNACRDESMMTNPAQAAEDARQLLRAGELRFGTDESTFNMVLCQRSFAQLRLIFEEYYKITGHDFEEAIKNEFSGNSKEGLLAIVRSIRNLPGFFAKCLHNAIAGLGTNDKTLIRVVTTRCEIDMGNIKQNYLAQYGETLADAIKGDTSGDYKKLLLALIGDS